MGRFWIAGFLVAWSTGALACQWDMDSRAPTNIELIERADLIVIGRIDPERPRSAPFSYKVGLTPVRTLKGEAPEKLTLYGTTRDRKGEVVRPFPTGLHGYHPSATWGSCDRQAYAPGSLVLATFRKLPDGYVQLPDRGVGDVEGQDDLWVRAASLYLRIIRENPSSRRWHAFKEARARLLAKTDDPEAKAIASDIALYLEATEQK